MLTRSSSKRAKVWEWLRRYGVAECAGITCALLGSFLVRRLTGSAIAAAYGAAWGESIGYGGTIIARDFLAMSRVTRAADRAFGIGDAGRVVTDLLAEFGPAGVLDTLVTRPRCRSGSLGVVIPLYASLESISYSCRERRKPNVA